MDMRILSIETSCDETAIALLQIEGTSNSPQIKTIANGLYSQAKLHEEFGGVFPTLAKREHQKNLPILLDKVLKDAGEPEDKPNIDFIAVTTGPGLEPALWTGITFAKELGERWEKRVVPVNHMEGHIWSVLLQGEESRGVSLPGIALLVSGGHTELVSIKGFGEYEILGQTVDDAVGEAYDKVARMLDLPYPGGPKISKLANEARIENIVPEFSFPRPMKQSGDLRFSFSGLKTAVLYKVKSLGEMDEETKKQVALAFEEAVMDVLYTKSKMALERYPDTKSFIVAGGVAANQKLRETIESLKKEFSDLEVIFPTQSLSTDNAIMIGLAAFIEVTKNPSLLESTQELVASGNLKLS